MYISGMRKKIIIAMAIVAIYFCASFCLGFYLVDGEYPKEQQIFSHD